MATSSLSHLKELFVIKTKELSNPTDWRLFIYDLIVNYTSSDSSTSPKEHVDILTSISKACTGEFDESLDSVLVDIFWLIDLNIETLYAINNQQQLQVSSSSSLVDANPVSLSAERKQLSLLIKECLAANLVQIVTLKERLEPDMLEYLLLVQSATVFTKKQIRLNTTLLYKQQRFNLLREESEGFAKLIMLLTDVKPDTDPLQIYNHCLSLIGYFDLDPTRVLDLILDEFAFAVDKKHSFFIKLLKQFDFSSTTVASIVAFKLKYLAAEANAATSLQLQRNTEEILELLMLSLALMIKYELVLLEQIFSHLYPSNEELDLQYADWAAKVRTVAKNVGLVILSGPQTKSANSNSTNSNNANSNNANSNNANSNPTSSTNNTGITDSSIKDEGGAKDSMLKDKLSADETIHQLNALMKCSNQRGHLIVALIRVGEFEKAKLLLDFSPNIVQLFSPISRHLSGLVHVIVEVRLPPIGINQTKLSPSYMNQFFDLNHEQLLEAVERLYHDQEYLPFLVRWLRYIGVGMWQDCGLAEKLCRLARSEIEKCSLFVDKEEGLRQKRQWIAIAANHLFPVLSLASPNPALCSDLWALLQLFTLQERWTAYGIWCTDLYERYPELVLAKAYATHNIRKVMRRLAKENVKQFGRMIGKMCHRNPLVILSIILEQVQAYDNMAVPVVEALKYQSPLGFDILVFVLAEALSTCKKDRLKEDGTHLAGWLQSLAAFTGTLGKRYAAVDLSGLLRYVAAQLWDENPLEFIVLSELIQKMAGTEPLANLTEVQLEGSSGWIQLRTQIIQNSLVGIGSGGSGSNSAFTKPSKKSSQRLLSFLLSTKLVWPLWIILAQQKDSTIFNCSIENISHLKLLSTLADQCHETFLHYTDFLTTHQDDSNLKELIIQEKLSLTELHCEYSIEPEIAAHLTRLIMSISDVEGDKSIIHSSPIVDKEAAQKVFRIDTTNQCLTESILDIFWKLELGDIFVPVFRYQAEIMRLKTLLSSSPDSIAGADPAEQARWKREREKAPHTILALESEFKAQGLHVAKLIEWIKERRSELFSKTGSRTDIVLQFVSRCIIPRALVSPVDALYAARFAQVLHKIGVPNFSTLSFFDRIINDVPLLIFNLTEMEAQHYGRFLSQVLGVLHAFHGDPEKYRIEGIGVGLPGFCKRWTNPVIEPNAGELKPENDNGQTNVQIDMQRDTQTETNINVDGGIDCVNGESAANNCMEISGNDISTNTLAVNETLDPASVITKDELHVELNANVADKDPLVEMESGEIVEPEQLRIAPEDLLQFEDFRHVLYKWHLKLHKAFVGLFESGEYMRIRNSIIILTRINDHFPILKKIGGSIEKTVHRIRDEENREDLKVLATRYSAMLSMQKNKWVSEESFHQCEAKVLVKNSTEPSEESETKHCPASALVEKSNKDGERYREKRDYLHGRKESEPREKFVDRGGQADNDYNTNSGSANVMEQEMKRTLEERRAAVIASQMSQLKMVGGPGNEEKKTGSGTGRLSRGGIGEKRHHLDGSDYGDNSSGSSSHKRQAVDDQYIYGRGTAIRSANSNFPLGSPSKSGGSSESPESLSKHKRDRIDRERETERNKGRRREGESTTRNETSIRSDSTARRRTSGSYEGQKRH